MKRNKLAGSSRISIKSKIFMYLALFTGITLMLLWLFQIVLLDDFYKFIKIAEIKSASEKLREHISDSSFEQLADEISEKNNVCIIVMNVGRFAIETYSADVDDECAIHSIDASSKMKLYRWAQSNGGDNLQRFLFDNDTHQYYSVEGDLFKDAGTLDAGTSESIIYTSIVTLSDGTDAVILLNSVISPVSATIRTLNLQLGVISVILLAIATLMAVIISRWIAQPIISINESAKKLADGNYDANFSAGGYREIAELSRTLNYAEEELGKVETLRRELIANISHDLRTPLTMIEGYSEIMRDIPGENTPENVQIIIDEAKRLTSLVNDALDISKLQAGVQTLNASEVKLTELIDSTLQRYSRMTEQKGYRFRFEFDESVVCEIDEIKFSQALCNLINNAITYTGEDKSVVVRQEVFERSVKISVSDSGEGIDPDKLELIWDRYYKVDKVHKRAAVGTGLGLSIVKGIVELHHGSCGVTSSQGIGSTFWMELPRTQQREQ